MLFPEGSFPANSDPGCPWEHRPMLKTCISVESCLERFAGSRDALANRKIIVFSKKSKMKKVTKVAHVRLNEGGGTINKAHDEKV